MQGDGKVEYVSPAEYRSSLNNIISAQGGLHRTRPLGRLPTGFWGQPQQGYRNRCCTSLSNSLRTRTGVLEPWIFGTLDRYSGGDGDFVLVWRGCHAALRPRRADERIEIIDDALIEAIELRSLLLVDPSICS